MSISALRPRHPAREQPLGNRPFPRTSLPEPEARGSRRLTQTVAVVALLVTLGYLAWRTLFTLNLGEWWISIPLLVLEVHAAFSLALFTINLWDVDATQPPTQRDGTDLKLAVLIPTFNEPEETLLPTVAAAVSANLAHDTWVLDDGARPRVQALAERLGARYLARPTHEHAKAGNVNHALSQLDADLVAIIDADHVVHADLFRNTLGYFDDNQVALVQTPQDFYNLHSFEHDATSASNASSTGPCWPGGTVGTPRSAAAPEPSSGSRLCATRGGWPWIPLPRTFTPPCVCTAVAGGPSFTTRCWPMDWPPPTWCSTSDRGCAGGPGPCSCCAGKTRPR